MDKIKSTFTGAAKILDYAAGALIVVTMVLTVTNIVLRICFKSPILGAYEFTGFLAALIIGLAISYCAVQNGHIAVDFIIEKLPSPLAKAIDGVTNTISGIFLGFFSWRIFAYGIALMKSNEVSPTTRTPFYYFVYLLGICFLLLCGITFFKAFDLAKGGKNP